MRIVSDTVKNTFPGARAVGMSLSYERAFVPFTKTVISDSLGLSDPSIMMDLSLTGSNIIRVVNFGNVLYTQLSSGVTFPSWTSTGKTLYPNSRPGVDISDAGIRIWYQDVTGMVNYYNYPAGTPVAQSSYAGAVACAPVVNGCYVQSMDGSWLTISYLDPSTGTAIWPGRIYGDLQTALYLDAVRINGVDYIFTMDKNAGRTLELQRYGDQWVGPAQVLPLDIVDNTSGFKLAFASAINGKIYVTGRMTRSNDLSPVSMDIVAIGPRPYEFGRYRMLTNEIVGGKVFVIGSTVHYVGLNQRLSAASTRTFGTVDASNTWSSPSGPVEVSISDSERGGAQAQIVIPASDVVEKFNDISLNAVINGESILYGSYVVNQVERTRDAGSVTRSISGVGKSLARLERWYPFQSIYMASQTALSSNPSKLDTVMRVNGTYATNTDGRMYMKELNAAGMMYGVARASASMIARGRFFIPTSSILKPRYGIGTCYYPETLADAAARLGVDPSLVLDSQYSNNGLVAIYGPAEAAGVAGIAVYEMTNNILIPITSAPLTIPPETLHWIQMQFVDGRIVVSFRYDSAITWSKVIDTIYHNQTRVPWSDQGDGRGFLYIENKTPYVNTVGFSSDATIIPIDDVSGMGYGIVRVDDELIQCTIPSTWPSDFAPVANLTFAPKTGGRLGYDPGWGVTGYPIVISGADSLHSDGYYVGACITVTDGPGKGTSYPIVAYDAISPATWVTTFLHYPATDDWHDYIDITPSHGHWITGAHRVVWVTTDPGATLDTGSILSITPALTVVTRGYNDTSATTHGAGKVSQQTDDRIQMDLFETFSGETDISVMDAFKRVFKMAGAGVPTFAPALVNPTITAAWTPNTWVTGRRNFIADMAIPSIPSGQAIGFSLRHDTVPTGTFSVGPNAAAGYMVLLRNSGVGNNLEFWKSNGSNFILKEQIAVPFTPTGTLRFSAQDNTFSLWINEVHVHSFQDGSTNIEELMATPDIGGVFSAIASYATATSVFVPQLCERLPDLPIDTMSNGWAAITTIIAQRRIYFSDTPDGSIYCYQTRTNCGNAPDVVTAWMYDDTDGAMTAIRAEGVKIAEYVDWPNAKQIGYLSMPINATYANSAGEVIREANLAQSISLKEARTHKLETVFYPGITPGDNWSFLLEGTRVPIQVLTVNFRFALSNQDLTCDMTLEGIDG